MARYSHVQYPQLQDADWLRERYVTRNMGPKAMAAELGCSRTAILHALGYAGIDLKGGRGPKRRWEPTREELIAEYQDAGSLEELARRKGLSKGTIRNAFRRHHVRPETVYISPRVRKYPRLGDVEWLTQALYDRTVGEVAEEIGCDSSVLIAEARVHDIPYTVRGIPLAVQARIVRLYVDERKSLAEVAADVGIGETAVWRRLRAAGVDTTRRTSRNGARLRGRGRATPLPTGDGQSELLRRILAAAADSPAGE